MAPEVTTTTVWPSRAGRRDLAAQAGHGLGRHRRRPDLDDGDHASSAPGEGHGADGDLVALARAGAGQRAVDPEAAQATHGLGLGARRR